MSVCLCIIADVHSDGSAGGRRRADGHSARSGLQAVGAHAAGRRADGAGHGPPSGRPQRRRLLAGRLHHPGRVPPGKVRPARLAHGGRHGRHAQVQADRSQRVNTTP